MKYTAIFLNPQGKQRRQQKYFANILRLISESDSAKDTPTPLQTMPSLILDLEIFSMCCISALVAGLLDQ